MTHLPEEQTAPVDKTRADAHVQSEVPAEGAGLSLFKLLCLLHSAGHALLAQTALHGQLARVEWAEERNRLLHMLLTTLFGFACALTLLLLCNTLVLVLSWDTPYRIPTLLGLLLVHGLGFAVACHRFRLLAARSCESFAAIREELAADLALLKSRL